jgi:acetate kinase
VNILTVNPGSSSLKLTALDDADRTLATSEVPITDPESDRVALAEFVGRIGNLDAAAVRLVHGGTVLQEAALVDGGLLDALIGVAELAPLHNPLALAALRTLRDIDPELPLVVCVDTAFHRTIPDAAATYALPWDWTTRYGIRKFGFHGLSHQYASRRAAELLDQPIEHLRMVTCHLGAGASLAAVAGGASVDTTMGFTPLDGLVMATRAGAVDPGIVIWVQQHLGLSPAELRDQLDRHSGLLGLSGRSADLQEVAKRASEGDQRCQLAIDVMVHRLVTSIAAMTGAAGGIDALVFTGGIGEAAPAVRRAACEPLAFLGVELGPANEAQPAPDAILSPPGAAVATLVVHAREDLQLAREARAVLSHLQRSSSPRRHP